MDLLASSLGSEVLVKDPVGKELAGHAEAGLALILEAEYRSASHTNGIGSAIAAVLGDDGLQLGTCNLAQGALEAENCWKSLHRNCAEVKISTKIRGVIISV